MKAWMLGATRAWIVTAEEPWPTMTEVYSELFDLRTGVVVEADIVWVGRTIGAMQRREAVNSKN
jgi:hypothetical protein